MKALTVGVVIVLLLWGDRVDAQGVASSFDQLTVLVKPGDKISVVDVTGTQAEGRIETLSRERLILITEAGPRQFGEVDVATIRQRRGDSLRNGAIIGAVAGATYYVSLLAIFWDIDGGEPIASTAWIGGVLFSGMGAAAGVGIDALIARRQVIYQKPAVETRVSVSPLIGRGRRGARVTVTF
jgi:hypothetical protein